MVTIPTDHKQDSLELNPEEFLELFEISLVGGGTTIYAHSGREIQWSPSNPNAPITFESSYIKVDNAERNSGEQRIRPTLTIGNPEEIFHTPVAEGHLDAATVTRYKVQPSKLDANPPVYERNVWYIAQITGLGEVITAQLRSPADRQEGPIPPRQYNKPEFPSIVI